MYLALPRGCICRPINDILLRKGHFERLPLDGEMKVSRFTADEKAGVLNTPSSLQTLSSFMVKKEQDANMRTAAW
jgi:hypothetical protein